MSKTRKNIKQIIAEEIGAALHRRRLREGPDTRARASWDEVHGRSVTRDDLVSDISDMAKELDGTRWPRTQGMSDEELHSLHDRLLRRLEDRELSYNYHDDIDTKPSPADLDDELEARYRGDFENLYPDRDHPVDPLDDAPEEGEDLPRRSGMRRRIGEAIRALEEVTGHKE
jgi:hypothetical protein